jgi:shikimate kinase
MAAGKSTIGKRLARKLGCAFYDVDDVIVEHHGEIVDIFDNEGEKAFRGYEHAAVGDIVEKEKPGIIALGGGAVTHEPTLTILKKRTYRVFIKVAPEQVLTRLRNSPVRPLLGSNPTLHKIKELYTKRMPYYAHSDLVVEADTLTPPQIVERIVEWLHKKHHSLTA